MTTHAHRSLANTLRTMLVDIYVRHGDAFGLAMARRCAWEIGEVVADIHGRAKAVDVLDQVSNALIENRPLVDPPEPPKALSAPAPAPKSVIPKIPAGMMLVMVPTTVSECDALAEIVGGLREIIVEGGGTA